MPVNVWRANVAVAFVWMSTYPPFSITVNALPPPAITRSAPVLTVAPFALPPALTKSVPPELIVVLVAML